MFCSTSGAKKKSFIECHLFWRVCRETDLFLTFWRRVSWSCVRVRVGGCLAIVLLKGEFIELLLMVGRCFGFLVVVKEFKTFQNSASHFYRPFYVLGQWRFLILYDIIKFIANRRRLSQQLLVVAPTCSWWRPAYQPFIPNVTQYWPSPSPPKPQSSKHHVTCDESEVRKVNFSIDQQLNRRKLLYGRLTRHFILEHKLGPVTGPNAAEVAKYSGLWALFFAIAGVILPGRPTRRRRSRQWAGRNVPTGLGHARHSGSCL